MLNPRKYPRRIPAILMLLVAAVSAPLASGAATTKRQTARTASATASWPAAHRAEATLSPVQINAEASVARLQRTGLIDAAQASAVDRQIAASSIDPNDLVASGVVDEAQMQAIGSAVDAAKAAG